MTVEVIQAKTSEEKAQCFAIRFEVFVDEQKVPPELEIDSFDDTSAHYLLLKDNQPLAAARVRYDKQTAFIERVAVRASGRGLGLGALLMKRMMEDIHTERVEKIEVSSQVQAVSFYEKLGFKSYGDIYDDAGIPHMHMRLRIV